MRRIAASSVILWFVMVILLAGNHAGGGDHASVMHHADRARNHPVQPVERYRRDMSTELAGQSLYEGDEG